MTTFILLWTPWTFGLLFWIYRFAKSVLDCVDLAHQPLPVEPLHSTPDSRRHRMFLLVKQFLPAYAGIAAWCLLGLVLGYFTMRRH